MKEKLVIFIGILFIATALSANNSMKKDVNILGWWGYLGAQWVKGEIKAKCNTEISYDEFYTSTEFLKRFKEGRNGYDIIIFPADTYTSIKSDIEISNSKLYLYSTGYYKDIKKHYDNERFFPNVVYFQHTASGILWNPKKLTITQNDNFDSIFKKAGSSLVVLLNDPYGLNFFIQPFDLKRLKSLIGDAKVYFTNERTEILDNENFAFSYQWQNVAMSYLTRVNPNSSYKYTIDPKYSYFSSDLLAHLNNNRNTLCVANILASREFLDKIQNDTYNYSPYKDSETVSNPIFKKLQESVFMQIPKLHWLEQRTASEYNFFAQKWKIIKLSLDNANK